MERREPTLIGSVQRALRIVNEIGAANGLPVSAKTLASRTGIALPTTYHLLRTLVFEGYLQRAEDGYVLGELITGLAAPNIKHLTNARIRPTLNAILHDLDAAAYFAVWDDGEIVMADIVDSPRAQRVELWVGFEAAGHATALGKCVLSSLPSSERVDYLARHQLADLTPHTITDRRRLDRELEQATATVVTDREEYAIGTACAAIPVATPTHHAALAISFSPQRLQQIDEMTLTLHKARDRIELALGVGQNITA